MIGDNWQTERVRCAFHYGGGFDKVLEVEVRFDGSGNSIVRFFVTNHGKEVSYEKFDSALGAYEAIQ